MLITPDSAAALVTDFETGQVTPIDLVAMRAATAIPVGGNPTGIALWKGALSAYVSGGNTVTPIDLLNLQAGAPLPVGTEAQGLAMGDQGRVAWVAGGNGTLVPVNVTTGDGRQDRADRRAADRGGDPADPLLTGRPGADRTGQPSASRTWKVTVLRRVKPRAS